MSRSFQIDWVTTVLMYSVTFSLWGRRNKQPSLQLSTFVFLFPCWGRKSSTATLRLSSWRRRWASLVAHWEQLFFSLSKSLLTFTHTPLALPLFKATLCGSCATPLWCEQIQGQLLFIRSIAAANYKLNSWHHDTVEDLRWTCLSAC